MTEAGSECLLLNGHNMQIPRLRRTARIGRMCLGVVLTFAAVAGAQPTGQLTGVVRDLTGALLPGARVSVTGADLSAPRTVVTNDRGIYEFGNLPAGRNVVEASRNGFESQTNVVNIESAPVTLDFVLAVGSLSESVTVTATKTGAADIQATPIAVTALSAAMLEQLGAQTVESLAGFVPTLTVSSDGGRPAVTIRGIGSNLVAAGSDPSSTIHLDGVYLARPSMVFMDFLNVERVEVLRGPQGTLYGRNSVGGTINVVTRQPTNSIETNVRLTAGNYDQLRAEGAVSGPLIKDKVMGNFAFLRGARTGILKDLDHPDHSVGSEDTWAGRGQLRVVFGAHNELLLSGDYARFAGVPFGYAKPIAAKPPFRTQSACSGPLCFDSLASPWEVRNSDVPSGENIQAGGSARLVIQVNDTTTLNSLTAYRNSNQRFFLDGDATELRLLALDFRDIQHQVSEELTVARRTARLTWIAGAFLFDDHDEGPVSITLYAPGVQQRPDPAYTTWARALFGQATYRVSDRVSLTGGLRHTDETKDLDSSGGTYRIGTAAAPVSFYSFVDRASYDAWTPKVSVEARATPDSFFYVSATRGFKSGGFNPSGTEPGHSYNPEFAWSFEGGLKNTTAGGRVHVNTAVFFTDHQDLQVSSLIRPGLLDITNAASAKIRGIEIEAAGGERGVHIAGHFSWLDATYGPYLAVGAGNVTGDAAGHRLNNAPEWSGSGSAVYEFATGRAGTAFVRGDVSWQSRVFFTPFNDAIETQPGYGLVHLRAGFGPHHRRWEIAVYARNVGNTEYITGSGNGAPNAITGRPGEPRHWGTQFTIRP
jgi:iron complex outermembrane receptor protein